MKKIFGIIALVLLSIFLGLSVSEFCDKDVTLVSEYSWHTGGAYG